MAAGRNGHLGPCRRLAPERDDPPLEDPVPPLLGARLLPTDGEDRRRPIEAVEQPARPGGPGAAGSQARAQPVVVADHEHGPGRLRSRGRAHLVDERHEQLVGRPPAGMADTHARRDALAAHAVLGHPVEDELDLDRGRDRPAQPADERRRRRRPGAPAHGVQQVRPVDEQSIGAGQRVARQAGHARILRAPGAPLRSST